MHSKRKINKGNGPKLEYLKDANNKTGTFTSIAIFQFIPSVPLLDWKYLTVYLHRNVSMFLMFASLKLI